MHWANPFESAVDYYLYPKVANKKQPLCPTYNIAGTECLLMTRSDATCWVFYCHGNTVTLSDLYVSNIAQSISERCKCNFVAPAYPAYQGPSGARHDTAIQQSVQAAYNKITQDHKQPVYIVGRSLGVAVSLHLDYDDNRPAGVVCISGFESVHRMLPCSAMRCVVADRYNNKKALENEHLTNVPKLLIHGDADSLIPIDHVKGLYSAACNSVLSIVPDMDHCPDANQWEAIYDRLASFVESSAKLHTLTDVAYPLWKC